MSTQPTLQFDATLARERGAAGKKRAAKNPRRQAALSMARLLSYQLARQHGVITADNIYAAMHPDYRDALGPCAGSVFVGDEWEFVDFRRSERVSNHGRILRSWRLKR